MNETQATNKDIEAVRRLQMYFRNNPLLVWQYGASDEEFMQWVKNILKVIRAEDMAHVKQVLEKGK
ncbi:MAG: hypothetical protein Q8L87_15360 [Anaerolineales bacterium]|nr:hypothetical protein [Anaerolineales bacterium]